MEENDIHVNESNRILLADGLVHGNSVHMSGKSGLQKPRFDWREDLTKARDLTTRDIEAYGYVLGWIEDWRQKRDLPAGREAARRWWKEVAKSKERPEWQLRQWEEAIRWFLAWLEICEKAGGDARSLPERLRDAVHHTGARRGLALKTRQTYAGWMMRFAGFAGTARRVMSETVAREWLSTLVDKEKVAFATQKQALNALVFFYRDVCGREELDLQVKMRKTGRRQPVILNRGELMGLIEKLEDHYKTAALLQYGAGLRLKELTSLRIKDVDLERGVVTIHAGKGDKDRETVIPNCLKDALSLKIEESLRYWEEDRSKGVAGVALPGALARKMPRAGEKPGWYWLFCADHLSEDPESGVLRRHHLHPKVYAEAIRRAAENAGIRKRVTTHALRHSFATDLIRGGTDIRTLQELLGHADVKTTEIYAHAAEIGNERGVRSPLDRVERCGHENAVGLDR